MLFTAPTVCDAHGKSNSEVTSAFLSCFHLTSHTFLIVSELLSHSLTYLTLSNFHLI